jgi:PAS domain S-box-containing protein
MRKGWIVTVSEATNAAPAGILGADGVTAAGQSHRVPKPMWSTDGLAGDDLRILVEQSADWVWETDADHRFSWISERISDHIGLKPEQILGKSRLELLEDVRHAGSSTAAHMADLEAHRPFRDFVYSAQGFRPECRWVSISGHPLFKPDGGFAGYRGIGRNVTAMLAAHDELERARQAIRLHEKRERELERTALAEESHAERMMAALNVLDDSFCYFDSNDRLILYNEAMLTVYAGIADQIRPGATFTELLDAGLKRGIFITAPHSPTEWRAEILRARRGERQSQVTIQMADGRWILRRDMRTDDGGTIGICTNVSDLKRHEQALAEASSHAGALLEDLQRTVDSMQMGVVVLDSGLHCEVINRAFYDIWKLQPQDVRVGSPFRALMDINRHNGVYDVPDAQWEEYVASRLAEIARGKVEPREFKRADGCTMIYSVTELSGGKRLVSYFDISDMKQREAQLAEALERARLADAVINGVRDPIFVKDAQLRFVFANEAFAEVFGLKPAQMIGKMGSHFVTPSEAARFEVSERQVLRTGEAYEVEENFEFQGIGKSRLVRKTRIRTDTGKDYVAGFLFDITEMKRRETDAEEARQRLENVIESLPAGVIIYDRHNRFVLSNRLVKDSLPAMQAAMQPGKPLREAIEAGHAAGYFRSTGDAELDALYDTDPAAWVDGFSKRYDKRQATYERQGPDGKWNQVFDMRTPDGTFIGVRVDITELKQREAALKASMHENELFRNLVDNVPVAIYAKHADLRLSYVNRGWSELTGIPGDQAIGLTDAQVFGPQGEVFMEGDRQALLAGVALEIEETATDLQGRERNQIARKSVMKASDGSLYLIGTTTDVTELKQRERELEEARQRAVLADRAKSEFLANMSHEIRTPMNGVLGMAELLAKSSLDPKQKTFTDIIVKSGNALLTIINDILDFSKIDAGQLVLDPAPFNLGEAIEDVATLVSTRAKEKDLELIVRVQPDLPEIFVGDVGRIRQIITNLLGNAVKFTDSGHVLVNVTGEIGAGRTKLMISVTDTGIGIPADKLKQVFEKFSQVDASSTRRHEGTGLGLAITSRLIELMEGRIDVTSEEGKGSTFTVALTLDTAANQKPRRHAPVDVTGARILVVDDNAVNRAILMEQMNSWTFDSCAAESGPEGLLVLETAARLGLKVDCVILDYQMPGMTGADVARVIRNNPAIAATPVIMLTSVDQSLSNKNYRDLEIDAHLIKPARSSALLDALVTTIQKHRSIHAPQSMDDPVATAEAARPASQARRPEPAAPSRARASAVGGHAIDILVAEDNEVNQLVFTQILGETDYSFEIVGNGRLALEAFDTMNPRMILMDVSMPQMNGLEATAAIRDHEARHGGHVPIVGVTAHALKGDRERCIEAGMDDYLSKPISPNALLAKVDLWMEAGNLPQRSAG